MNTKKYKIMANAQNAIGVHSGPLTRRTKTNIQAHTLVCFDTENYVKTCSATDIPFGIALKDASPENPLVCILPLNCGEQTACLKVEGNINAGQYICVSNHGLVKALPSEEGTYTILGIALSCGLDNDYIEALTTLPYSQEIK